MKKKVFLFGVFAICIALFGGFSKVNAQTTYDIRVIVGPPDCEALQCQYWYITLYEYSSSLGSKYIADKQYIYGTSTYNFDDITLDQGYTEFYVTMTHTGSCTYAHHEVTSSHWVPNPPPYSHTFEVNPCGY